MISQELLFTKFTRLKTNYGHAIQREFTNLNEQEEEQIAVYNITFDRSSKVIISGTLPL